MNLENDTLTAVQAAVIAGGGGMKALVLFSGGMDSTTLLTQVVREGFSLVHAVSFYYGSKHGRRELQAANEVWNNIAELAKIKRIQLLQTFTSLTPDVFDGAQSALAGDMIDMPHMTYEQLMDEEGPSPTVVPFRNAYLISAATAMAASRGYDYVYVATHATDAHNWAYPDCTPEFLGAMSNAIYIGTYHQVRLMYPFVWMRKEDIAKLGGTIGAPLHLSYSCYEGGEKHCGVCPTCIERKEAFRLAGLGDPTEYNNA